jgi:hypothetical protein
MTSGRLRWHCLRSTERSGPKKTAPSARKPREHRGACRRFPAPRRPPRTSSSRRSAPFNPAGNTAKSWMRYVTPFDSLTRTRRLSIRNITRSYANWIVALVRGPTRDAPRWLGAHRFNHRALRPAFFL